MEGLVHLALLDDEDRSLFLRAVARQLSVGTTPSAMPALRLRFGLDFSEGEPAALLLGAKLLLCRIVPCSYQPGGSAALRGELAAAGLGRACSWLCDTAMASICPSAVAMRNTLAHGIASLTYDYLEDFDWHLHYVLASSTHAQVHMPLVHIELAIRKAESRSFTFLTEKIEIEPHILSGAIDSLAAAQKTLTQLTQADNSRGPLNSLVHAGSSW